MKNLKNFLEKPAQDLSPWAIWIWNHSISREKVLTQFKSFVNAGFSGVAIKPGKDLFPSFLSEEFFELLDSILSLAREHNVQIRIADDFSTLKNTTFQAAINQTKNLRAQQLILEQNIVPSEHEDLTLHIDKPENALVMAVKISDHQMLLNETRILNVKPEKNIIVWKAVHEEWRIFVFRKQFIENCQQEYLPNVLNVKTASLYIQNVLDPLKNRFAALSPLPFCGILTEFPLSRPCNNALPWDDDLLTKFKAQHKKDLIKLLPALFFENCGQSQKIRQQFYSFLFEYADEQFIKPIEAWAKKNHLTAWILHPEKSLSKCTNEFIGEMTCTSDSTSPAGLQNLAGVYENGPLIRHFSDCNTSDSKPDLITVLGRNVFGLGGSPQSLKSEFDYSTVLCQSTPVIDGFYTNIDHCIAQRSPVNPGWYSPEWPYMKNLCHYISRVRGLCKNVKWTRQAAVLSPLSEMISDYYPNNSEYAKVGFAIFQKTLATLDRLSITYDCMSEAVLSSCEVNEKGGFTSALKNRSDIYNAVIIPFAPLIAKSVLSFIEKAVQKGTVVYFIDEISKGTVEDGITPAITSRMLKLIDPKKNHVRIVKSDSPDSGLAAIETPFFTVSNSRRDSDVSVAWGKGEHYDLYIMHNMSDSKDLGVHVELPEHKHFCVADCENGEIYELETIEKGDGKLHFDVGFLPHETVYLLGSAVKLTSQIYTKNIRSGVNAFSSQHRSYRIVLKDQWNFSTGSLNSYPIGYWNLRMGLSRDSGGFSHFYEASFQIKSLPRYCCLILSDSSLIQSSLNTNDNGIELSVNGIKVDRQTDVVFPITESGNALPDVNFNELFPDKQLVFDVASFLISGNNRISIRTTGKPCHPQTMHMPPFLLGNFAIVKDKGGLILDNLSEPVGYGSWAKSGYPYLSGKGVYSQSFEVPSEYKRIILKFSQVSGSVQVKLNGKDLGIFNWHPMQVDITQYCQQKKNEIEIAVLNTVDNVIRMNGHPSGLIGEVYLDVF